MTSFQEPNVPNQRAEQDSQAASRLTLLHLAIVGLCASGFTIDLMEVSLGGALSAVFSAPPHGLKGTDLSWLLTAVYAGAIAGAPLAGWISDRLGLKTTLAALVLWLGVTSIAAAISPSAGALTAARFLSGLALGGYPPLMIAYLTDITPQKRRGAIIFSVCAIAYLAPPIAIFSLRWATPLHPLGLEGWRWPFLVAGAVCLAAGLGFRWAPEAPNWLASVGRVDAAASVAARFGRSRTVLRSTRVDISPGEVTPPPVDISDIEMAHIIPKPKLAMLSLVFFLIPWATASFPLLAGPILLARHFSLADTLLYVGIATVGPAVGTLIGALFVDRINRRRFMMGCAVAMLVAVGLFFIAEAAIFLAVAMTVFGIFSAIYMPIMTLFGAEQFGPRVRGRAMSLAWVTNRVGAAVSPMILIPLVTAHSYATVATVLCFTLVGSMLVLAAPVLRSPK